MLQPLIHELDGQPVEQCRVRRRRALAAEVEDRRHQRLAEVPHPDVVDGDAGRQRMPRIGHPAGQRRAAAGAGRRERLAARRLGFEVRFRRLERAAQRRVRLARRLDGLLRGRHGIAGRVALLLGARPSSRHRPGAVPTRRGRGFPPRWPAPPASRPAPPTAAQVVGVRRGRLLKRRAIRRGAAPAARRAALRRPPAPSRPATTPAAACSTVRRGSDASAASTRRFLARASASRAAAICLLRDSQVILEDERPQARVMRPPAAACTGRISRSAEGQQRAAAPAPAAGP